ncbi:tRNA (5-methylaminomethyl-2-thiouridine)(34)-methyltransferase MnmD [Parapusillimonas sp. SGNA-6]|uniref:tRNA (5-methylaminomethyl-2-thiouridine)(34)-methyltransferase MnmD n=1 Tax=Parapedobacter sp. SGR-10 TaxID=2710879 RepID=UPI0013D3686C|nr:tRNA (5-methylaminomethyl-2-thiouridine)(34)-methyltransferase MnmD [Parapedobacter sp. SGR-10]NGF55085.1 tRNA (5-methylaminomethyl-2-thiouridine)(34)-methyltransferase MnmD [Parapedobacter sp. SGR-10]NGM90817.1 tRNA (5-methylaminomethyl-2-thiouridine)(34)-methyltransferase MnmD [Parapusillimonas sp. SGNA-6]
MDFVTTGDGSKTLYHADVGEHYHSKHGALQESQHVFLKSGLQFFLEKEDKSSVAVLEVGFGTGLNFLLTAEYCTQHSIGLDYCGIEAYPLSLDTLEQSGYATYVQDKIWKTFTHNYPKALSEYVQLDYFVGLQIPHTKVLDFETEKSFDVIYFDAFAAVHQPEMWNDATLAHVTKFLKPGGVFVTYAITGNLKRSMKALGFSIEKAPGAPGKREMLRAVKLHTARHDGAKPSG